MLKPSQAAMPGAVAELNAIGGGMNFPAGFVTIFPPMRCWIADAVAIDLATKQRQGAMMMQENTQGKDEPRQIWRSDDPLTVPICTVTRNKFLAFRLGGRPFPPQNCKCVRDANGLWWCAAFSRDFWWGLNPFFDGNALKSLKAPNSNAICQPSGSDDCDDPFLVDDPVLIEETPKPTTPPTLDSILQKSQDEVGEALAATLRRIRWSENNTRVLLAIHQRAWVTGSPNVELDANWLARRVWGRHQPRKWLQELERILKGLCWLHAISGNENVVPKFSSDSALLLAAGRPSRKCFQVEVGLGFLGALAHDYGIQTNSEKVAGLFRQGMLRQVYLPVELGAPKVVHALTDDQRRLVHILVHETTRMGKSRVDRAYRNRKVPDYKGRAIITCKALDEDKTYAAFNGNLRSYGGGYKPDDWIRSYAPNDVSDYATLFHNLTVLSDLLGLVVVGVPPDSEQIYTLDQMRAMAATREGKYPLHQARIRIYVETGWRQRWNKVFDWPDEANEPPAAPPKPPEDAEFQTLKRELLLKKVRPSEIVAAVGRSRKFIYKVLSGKKSCPAWIKAKIKKHLADRPEPSVGGTGAGTLFGNCKSNLDYALAYRGLGWSVVPLFITKDGSRAGRVEWKPFQTKLPSIQLVRSWWRRWPDALIGLVLGPVSGVFAVDSDGPKAATALLKRLRRAPRCPKAISGSRKPGKFHLFFKHPPIETQASFSPWYDEPGEKLEFRGNRGLLVLTPSLHPSGNTYAWVDGQSIEDIALPEVPPAIMRELQKKANNRAAVSSEATPVPSVSLAGIKVSKRTKDLLSGRYAFKGGWNNNIFNVACDLAGREVPRRQGLELIVAAFKPQTDADMGRLERTVESAYSQPRTALTG